MAVIKAKVIVGGKQTLSLDESPILGGGTPAPLSSVAYVNDAGVASMWQKTGPGDTDWTMVQSGSGEDGWNVGYAITELDNVTADAYFGSNADSFDGKIIFCRRGNVMLEMRNDNSLFTSRAFKISNAGETSFIQISGGTAFINFTRDSGVTLSRIRKVTGASAGFYVEAGTATNLYVTGQIIKEEVTLNAGGKDTRYADTFASDKVREGSSAKIFKAQLINNAGVNLLFSPITNLSDNQPASVEMTILITDNTSSSQAMIVKTCHIYNSQVQFQQDSFVNQNVQAQGKNVVAELSLSAGQFNLNLKTNNNATSFTSADVVILTKEIKREFI